MKTAFIRFIVYIISWFIVRAYLKKINIREKQNEKEDLRLNERLETLSEQYERLCYKEDEIGNEIARALICQAPLIKTKTGALKNSEWCHGDFERLSDMHGFSNNELFIEHLKKEEGIETNRQQRIVNYSTAQEIENRALQRNWR